MSLGNCPKCGWAMRIKIILGITVWVECSNPYCDNKIPDQYEVSVTSDE